MHGTVACAVDRFSQNACYNKKKFVCFGVSLSLDVLMILSKLSYLSYPSITVSSWECDSKGYPIEKPMLVYRAMNQWSASWVLLLLRLILYRTVRTLSYCTWSRAVYRIVILSSLPLSFSLLSFSLLSSPLLSTLTLSSPLLPSPFQCTPSQ